MWSFCVHPERLRRRNMTEPLNPLARFSCSEAEVCWSTCRTFCPRLTVQAPGKIRCSYSLTDLSIFQQHIWMTHVFVCKVGPYTLQSASTEQKKRRKLSWVATIYVCAWKKLSITRTEGPFDDFVAVAWQQQQQLLPRLFIKKTPIVWTLGNIPSNWYNLLRCISSILLWLLWCRQQWFHGIINSIMPLSSV